MTPFIVFCAAVGYGAESIFGFGGSVVTFLLLTLMLPAKEAVALLPVFALAGSLFILASDRAAVKWLIIRNICLSALPGLVLGILLISRMPDRLLAAVVLVIIIAYGISLAAGRNPAVPLPLKHPLYFISGFVMGITSLGVLFLPAVGTDLGDRRSFRASLALLWFITACVRVPLFLKAGVLSPAGFISGLWAIPPQLLAIALGFRIHKRISEKSYRRAVGGAISAVAILNLAIKFALAG